MIYEKQEGVPKFECTEYEGKNKDFVVLIPIINEGEPHPQGTEKSLRP